MNSGDNSDVRVTLRLVESDDLPVLFEFQLDPDANDLAATYPRNADDFHAHWDRIVADSGVTVRSILACNQVVGSISCFNAHDQNWIGYWIGRQFWGQGIATMAVKLLLREVSVRPLYARVAERNVASVRVLQKNGFRIFGHQHSPEDERFQECEEVLLKLTGDCDAQ